MLLPLARAARNNALSAQLTSVTMKRQLFRPFSSSDSNTGTTPNLQFDGPLELLQGSTKLVKEASERLVSIQNTINEPVVLNKGTFQERPVSFRDIVLHSRDAVPADFHDQTAVKAREQALPIAEQVESDLKDFSSHYTQTLKPLMDEVAKICRDLPCGGASFEVEKLKQSASSDGRVSVEGEDTPCGKFSSASLEFLQTTYDTREQVTLGSRSALILRLAQEFNEPLATVRKEKEGQQRMGKVFAEEVVPTPWVKSEEEYQEFFRIKEQIESDNQN